MYTELSSTYFNPLSTRVSASSYKRKDSDEILLKNEESIRNIKNYRNYIHQQMESLHKQLIKQDEQNEEILQRVYEANCMLKQMHEMLKKQLQNYNSMYADALREKDGLQVRNLNIIMKLRQAIEQQSALNKISAENKALSLKIRNEMENNKKEKNCLEIMSTNEVKKNQIQLINKQIHNFKQNQQHFHANDAKLINKIKQVERESDHKCKIVSKLNQQVSKMNKLKKQKQKQKVSLLQIRKENMVKKENAVHLHKQILERSLVEEKNEKNLISQSQTLVYQIKIALKDLELEQRTREKEQQQIGEQKERMKNNMYQLQSLKYYQQELDYSNQIVRKSAQQFGLLKVDSLMTFQQSKVNPLIETKDVIQLKTIDKLQIRPIKNLQIRPVLEQRNQNEKDRMFIGQQKQNVIAFPNESRGTEQGVTEDCQIRLQKYKAHQIPKEVSDIIKKYKEKQHTDVIPERPNPRNIQKKQNQNCLQQISNRLYSIK